MPVSLKLPQVLLLHPQTWHLRLSGTARGTAVNTDAAINTGFAWQLPEKKNSINVK